MLVLHGIYDNGKIEIEEKDLPKIKAKIKVIIEEEQESMNQSKEGIPTLSIKSGRFSKIYATAIPVNKIVIPSREERNER